MAVDPESLTALWLKLSSAIDEPCLIACESSHRLNLAVVERSVERSMFKVSPPQGSTRRHLRSGSLPAKALECWGCF
jgi:hypothetical protein